MRIKARNSYVRKSNNHGTFWILDKYINDKGKEVYKIKFPETGYETTITKTSAEYGKEKDFRNPIVAGVGYLGDDYKKIHEEDKELCTNLRHRWKGILIRCYGKVDKKHESIYKNVIVDKRWHNFSNFYYDVQKLEGFNREDIIANYKLSIDKDKYQSNNKHKDKYKIYSKDTCCWLTPKEQQIYTPDHFEVQKKKKIMVTFPDGHIEMHEGQSRFAREYNLDNGDVGKCLKGTKNHVKGFKFKLITEED